MPHKKRIAAKAARRGGVVKTRTKQLPENKYMHVRVVRKKGPRGGKTIGGCVHKKKSVRGK